ncbi:hypothetical protein [Solibacillus isronensis]|uniref:hypothetical protein n=1 Tax=Solibacillus isronensis TaxID=412383 RepID=UPI0039A28A86
MGITIRSTNNIPKVKKALKEVSKKEIKVGIFDQGELGMIAAVHEFGAEIPVTPKMRGWFSANGYPLKASTTTIVIPERSFIRAGFDEYHTKIADKIEVMLPQVLMLAISSNTFLDAIGVEFASLLKKYTNELSDPPNSEMTIERKKSSNPLIDSGRMRNAITYKVE